MARVGLDGGGSLPPIDGVALTVGEVARLTTAPLAASLRFGSVREMLEPRPEHVVISVGAHASLFSPSRSDELALLTGLVRDGAVVSLLDAACSLAPRGDGPLPDWLRRESLHVVGRWTLDGSAVPVIGGGSPVPEVEALALGGALGGVEPPVDAAEHDAVVSELASVLLLLRETRHEADAVRSHVAALEAERDALRVRLDRLTARYDALKGSRLGAATLRYWTWRKRVAR
ncbi:hypothetical protein [Cellulomonas sp.]|uniref:hypothetical protein n=1 Tax=Cellulomonas sp. TaxID=40001 RepID=UPI001B26CB8C|nr:hypothetical protein [Cellulomonas sp.]MBO9556774.1 hypothetical protein [Cellulomonas sp.]